MTRPGEAKTIRYLIGIDTSMSMGETWKGTTTRFASQVRLLTEFIRTSRKHRPQDVIIVYRFGKVTEEVQIPNVHYPIEDEDIKKKCSTRKDGGAVVFENRIETYGFIEFLQRNYCIKPDIDRIIIFTDEHCFEIGEKVFPCPCNIKVQVHNRSSSFDFTTEAYLHRQALTLMAYKYEELEEEQKRKDALAALPQVVVTPSE